MTYTETKRELDDNMCDQLEIIEEIERYQKLINKGSKILAQLTEEALEIEMRLSTFVIKLDM